MEYWSLYRRQQEILVDAPLYAEFDLAEIADDDFAKFAISGGSIDLYCIACKRKSVFHLEGLSGCLFEEKAEQLPYKGLITIKARCGRRDSSNLGSCDGVFYVWLYRDFKKMTKIGQYPSKATILHSEHNRPEEYIAAGRMARHYYDVYKLAQTPILNKALDNLDLLNSVVEHKKTFFKRAGANYDDACNGNIRLVPEEAKLRTLKVDYEGMKDMFFGAAPSFDEIIASLEELQKVINMKVSSRAANKEVV